MQLKEAFTVFSYIGFLIEDFESRYKDLSLDERDEILQKISEAIDREDELVHSEWRLEEQVLKNADNAIRMYKEYEKTRRGEPMLYRNKHEVHRWVEELLTAERLKFILRNVNISLKSLDPKNTTRKLEALNPLLKWFVKQQEILLSQMEDRGRKLAIRTAIELKKHGVPVKKVKVAF